MPKTGSGKIQKHRLRDLCDVSSSETHSSTRDSIVEWTFQAIESLVCTQVQHVLRDSNQLVQDSPLFEQGMSSSQAVQIVLTIQSAISVQLPATMVLNYPTLRKLALAVWQQQSQSRSSRLELTQMKTSSTTNSVVRCTASMPRCADR